MAIVGYVRAAIELAALVLLVLVYMRIRGLPACVLRMLEAAHARGVEDAAARLVDRIAQISGDGSGLIIQLRALLEEQDERSRAERAASEVRARIAERRAASVRPADVAAADDDDEVTRHRTGSAGAAALAMASETDEEEETKILLDKLLLGPDPRSDTAVMASGAAVELLRVGPDEPTPVSGTPIARLLASRPAWVLVSTSETG